MKKHIILSIILMAVFILLPFVVHAAIFVTPTTSFGGRVLSTEYPDVECDGLGTGPLIIEGVDSIIPYYALTNFSGVGFVSAVPKMGDWILGRVNIEPEESSCYTEEETPFPVKDTSFYGLSN